MIILIAESKTMQSHQTHVSEKDLAHHLPSEESGADEIMDFVSGLQPEDIMQAVKVSYKMALDIIRLAKEFPFKQTGLKAIEAFTGVVFKNFDYDSLGTEFKENTAKSVRIISSLYGWLRPDDIIKPYRSDFSSRLAPDDRTLAEFHRKNVTIHLVRDVQENNATDILNLLPADAAKCIDWKLVKRFAKVWKVDFKQIKDGGSLATPHAGLLKAARGKLLREIITQGISSPIPLQTLATESLIPLGCPDYPDHIAFCLA